MKTLQKVILAIVLISLFSACQSNTDVKKILAKSETRTAIMDTIANNSEMSKEMMTAMMNSQNGKMMMMGNEEMTKMMMENNGRMMKMMQDNPAMMQNMMSDMMKACNNDPKKMSAMCKTMMENKPMMQTMKKMKK